MYVASEAGEAVAVAELLAIVVVEVVVVGSAFVTYITDGVELEPPVSTWGLGFGVEELGLG